MKCAAGITCHINSLFLPWLYLSPGQTPEPLRRLARVCRQSEVDLCDLGTSTRTGIRDCKAHPQCSRSATRLGLHLEPGVHEAGIGEPVSEREERLDAELVVAPVADTEALAVAGNEVASTCRLLG